jgi:hypothetical protein
MIQGFALQTKVNQLSSKGMTMREIVLACGYGRENRVPQYTEFYTQLIKVKAYDQCMQVRDSERNNYSNMRQKSVTDAMFYGENLIKNNDEVRSGRYNDCMITSYHFYGELLVKIVRGDGPVYAILNLPSKKSRTAKSRINAILRRNFGYSLYQKKGEWYIVRPFKDDILYTEGVRLEFPEI